MPTDDEIVRLPKGSLVQIDNLLEKVYDTPRLQRLVNKLSRGKKIMVLIEELEDKLK